MPEEQSESLHHVRKMGDNLRHLSQHMREDIKKVDDPQFRAMFETAAEVLDGLAKAFKDYEEKKEKAWNSPL